MVKLKSEIAIVFCMWAVAHVTFSSWHGLPPAYGLSPHQSRQNQAPLEEKKTAEEVLSPLTDEERALNLRELIARQPDFGADLEFFVAEHNIGGAHGFAYKVVRKGKRFREESKFWVFVGEVGIRTARLFPPSKSYDDMEPPRGESMEEGGLLSNPNILLADAGMALSALGKLEIEGHSCLKIEASRKDQPEKIYLYAARDLKNLIIVTQIIGPEKSTIARLRNVTFDLPDDLVQIPSDYRVIERDRWVKLETAEVIYDGRLYQDAVVFRAPRGELFIRVNDYKTYLVRPDLRTVEIAFEGLLVTSSGEYVWRTKEREAFSKTNYRLPRRPGPYDPKEEERRVTVTPNSVKFRWRDGPLITVRW